MKSPQRIAIVGSGISGLAIAYFWSRQLASEITLIDELPPGAGTERIDAGLVHSRPGPAARKVRNFEVYRSRTLELLQVAARHSSTPVFTECGLFRIASTPKKVEAFRHAAESDHEVIFTENARDLFKASQLDLAPAKGLFIPKALAINVPNYTVGLWTYLKKKNVRFVQERVFSVSALLAKWDLVILAGGYSTAKLYPPIAQYLRPLRGQWIVFRSDAQCPSMGLSDQVYTFPIPGRPGHIFAGATFEHTCELWLDELGRERAEALIAASRRLLTPYPLTIARQGVSIRCTSGNRLPICTWINERLGILTALGSKGLTRHADCAHLLVSTHKMAKGV